MSEVQRFLSRWSRLKRQPAAALPAKGLAPLESLADDADFSAYVRLEVEESLRRRALKRIFSDPGLNVMDGLDVYVGDYSIADPIPAEMLAQMNSARLLFSEEQTQNENLATSQGALALDDDETAGIRAASAAGPSAMKIRQTEEKLKD